MRDLIKKILKEEYGSNNLPMKLSGSYQVPKNIISKGDALHSFDRRKMDGFGGYMLTGSPVPSKWSSYVKLDQGKGVNQVLKDLVKSGVKPDVTDISVTVNNDYSVNWSITIDESKDGNAYIGVSSRGSAGSNADGRASQQISRLKSKNSKSCNWTQVLDLNVSKPIKIRQFFLKYTDCSNGNNVHNIDNQNVITQNDKPQKDDGSLNKFSSWKPGEYKLKDDTQWSYRLTNDKEWEAKKDNGEYVNLKNALSSDNYQKALNALNTSELI